MSDLKAISDTNPHDTAEEILARARLHCDPDIIPDLVVTPQDDDTPEVSFEMLDESENDVRVSGHPGTMRPWPRWPANTSARSSTSRRSWPTPTAPATSPVRSSPVGTTAPRRMTTFRPATPTLPAGMTFRFRGRHE